jgi:hypothetical protein
MVYAITVIKKILEEKIGKRQAQQIICIIMLVCGVKKTEIREKTGASQTSLYKYEELIETEKLEKIFEAELYRPVSELEKHSEKITEDFAENPPKNRREAAERIKRLTGIERAVTNAAIFLKKKHQIESSRIHAGKSES